MTKPFLPGCCCSHERKAKLKGFCAICATVAPRTQTPSALDDHADDDSIVDGCHAGLFIPNHSARRSDILLSGDVLVASCSASTRCIFVNCFAARGSRNGFLCAGYNGTALARGIAATEGSLQCFSAVESAVTEAELDALCQCPELRGSMLVQCGSEFGEAGAKPANDEAMARVLRSCPKLRWLFVQPSSSPYFGTACFEALARGCCPDLELLWVTGEDRESGLVGRCYADPASVRRALCPGSALASTLRVCMIAPDNEMVSRYILGGHGKNADRLDGKKPEPMPSYTYRHFNRSSDDDY